MSQHHTSGQAMVEYALILALIALVAMSGLSVLGISVSRVLTDLQAGFSNAATTPTGVQSVALDFLQRIMDYYRKNGKWPPTWGDQRFTVLGLNPADWKSLVNGILWNPNGQFIGLANQKNDKYDVYVRDTKGNQLKLYDGWNIWCNASSGRCYYHTADSGIEVDLSTVESRPKTPKPPSPAKPIAE